MDLSKEFHPFAKSMQLRGVNHKEPPKEFVSRGRKVKFWLQSKTRIVKDFKRRGIISCELMLAGCTGKSFLTYLHVDKRKNLWINEMDKVVLGCVHCHDIYEQMPAKVMREKLESVIANRTL